jgi:ribosomal protein S12 methylthiotransferase
VFVQKQRVNIITLGCPKNLVDSEVLLAQLQNGNVELVKNIAEADTVLINTCGFIQDAKQESINTIIETVEKKNHGELKKIFVMGCLSERFKQELAEEIPEVDSFFGTHQMPDVLNKLGVDFKTELLGERVLTTPSHYAYLKIAEGCDNPCSFCAIPLMRGGYRSKLLEDIIHEARLLALKGVKELIVIAQDTTYYGLDIYGEQRLAKLLGELNNVDGIEWIRLMYTYPTKFPLDLIEAFHKYPKLCRYIDIPIQHYSDNILRSMRRGITQRTTRELLMHLKAEIPDLAIRTTIIVGYPNETEADFEEMCNFVETMKFHRLGVFTYSQEEGTAAFNLGDPIPQEIKNERQMQLMELQNEISKERNEATIGKTIKVIIDSRDGDYFIGRTDWDAPEIDQEVIIHSDRPLVIGNFYSVTVTNVDEYDLFASM